jgi:predicted nucleic acid-binding protein
MGQKYLIDTNTLIDAQMKRIPEKGLQFLAGVINEDFTVSFITYIEFFGLQGCFKSDTARQNKIGLRH